MDDLLNKKPNSIEKLFFRNKIAKKIYSDFLLPKLNKYDKKYEQKQELKNILFVNTAAGKGGAAKIAHNLLNKSLIQRGYNSKILVNESYCEDDSIELLEHKNPALHKMLHKYQRANGMLDLFNTDSFNILETEHYKKADIVHLNNLHGSYFSLFLLPQLTAAKPTVWTLHDEQSFTGHCAFTFGCEKWLSGCEKCPNLNSYPKLKKDTAKFLFNLKKQIYENSNFTIVCYSQWLKDRISKSILKDKEIKLIYNGIDEKIFFPHDKVQAREKLNLPADKKILLFGANGGLKNPQKGGEYILEAFEFFKNNSDIVFVCLGNNKTTIKNPNWIDIPYISDEKTLSLYYSAADLFLCPSLAETFGLVIAESMSCGTPVIAFDNSTIPELVKHMETGYLAKNKNTSDFINGIKVFLNSEETRKSANIKSRENVLEKFTLDRMIDDYISLYREILKV